MEFSEPLISGRLHQRYKRFLADVELESGDMVVAHCANPGSMLGLAEPGMPVWLSRARNPARKLRYSWELVMADGGLVGINTAHPNGIVVEALAEGLIVELTGYDTTKREVRYGRNSRIDLLLERDGRPPCYVEVKNVTLKRGATAAEFPDSVTQRGAKHLEELSDMVRSGARAVMFYLVQRSDCSRFEIARDIDPAYGRAFDKAVNQGVEVMCYSCSIRPEAIELGNRLKVVPLVT